MHTKRVLALAPVAVVIALILALAGVATYFDSAASGHQKSRGSRPEQQTSGQLYAQALALREHTLAATELDASRSMERRAVSKTFQLDGKAKADAHVAHRKAVAKAKRIAAAKRAKARAAARAAEQRRKQAAASPQYTSSSQSSSYGGSLGSWLHTLRMCESGGNYRINTGNGYYGAYQFSASTWNSLPSQYSRYSRADLAPPSVQDAAIIYNTKRSSGGLATQNPGCYSKYHLSAFPPG